MALTFSFDSSLSSVIFCRAHPQLLIQSLKGRKLLTMRTSQVW